MGPVKLRRALLAAALLLFAGLFLVARGTHVSNALKKVILPEISDATGRKAFAQRIYINLFPLFLEARELKLTDQGEELLFVPKVKAYFDLSGLLNREIVVKRLVIQDVRASTDERQVADIIAHVEKYLAAERQPGLKARVEAVSVQNGQIAFRYGAMHFAATGMNTDLHLALKALTGTGQTVIPRLSVAIKELSARVPGWPELKGEVKVVLMVKGGVVDIRGMQVDLFGSLVNASGSIGGEKGELFVRLGLLMESFKRAFGLKERGEGTLSAKGTVALRPASLAESSLDLELRGEFPIQTLMELVKVKERVEGPVEFSGSVKGPLKAITGSAKARLKKGNLFGVEVDHLTTDVSYAEGSFFFRNGKAALYRGTGQAEAVLTIVGPSFYSVTVHAADIDSSGIFKLIAWDPGLQPGKVTGGLKTEGSSFNPAGWFTYTAATEGPDVLGRVKNVKGHYRLEGSLLTLSEAEAKTVHSSLVFGGTVDISSGALSLDTEARTADLRDVSAPYLTVLTGGGGMKAHVGGTAEDPRITGRVRMSDAAYDGYPLGAVRAEIDYRKNLLRLEEVVSAFLTTKAGQSTHTVKGSIAFPQAKQLFAFQQPVYTLNASMINGDAESVVRFLYDKPLAKYPTGRASADFSITGSGKTPLLRGRASVSDLRLDEAVVDIVTGGFSYDYHTLALSDAVARRGKSAVRFDGTLSERREFTLHAEAGQVFLSDLTPKILATGAYLTLRATGQGTLDNPAIDLDASLSGGKYRDVDLGKGSFSATLRGKTCALKGRIFHDRIAVSGGAELHGSLPWTARLDLRPGRYDSLINVFVKDLPEDLLLNMKGSAEFSGDRGSVRGHAVINQVNVTAYGNNFSSDSDVKVDLQNRKVTFAPFSIRGGGVFFKLAGGLELGREYDLVVEGRSSLLPLKFLTKRIEEVRGDAEYVFAVTGAWDNPRVNGGIQVYDGIVGVKDLPYRLSSISGYVSVDEGKIIVQKVTGKMGGGTVNISGLAYLTALKLSRYYLDVSVSDIGFEVSKDFPVNASGDLLFKGTADSQSLSGEVRINRARYGERVEWRSWLLKARTKERPRGDLGVLEKVALNVKVYGAENITVNNNIARASLKVDMLLRGTLAYPVLLGRVETEAKSGTVYFRNNEFNLISASADFSDPRRINPVVNIVAQTSVKGYTIRMNLEGQLDRFSLALVSDPPLEEVDILGLLTVGRFGKELKGIEGGIGAGAAASFMTGKFQDVMEERMRTVTGLDRIEVEPYVSKTTGAISPRVTVSKRLMGDRLFVTYSSPVGTAENNVLKLEYLFGKNLSLVGVRDEQGGVGGDVKFRFEFK